MSLEGKRSVGPSKEKIKITLVNVDDLAEEAAHDAAERNLTASKESMKGFKGFFKKIWTHGMAREYYRQKQLGRAREAIAENEDIYAAEQNPQIEKNAHEYAMKAVVDRFSLEYKETLHAGEEKTKIDKNGEGKEKALHDGVAALVREYAAGKLTDENFNEARTRLLSDVSETQGEAKKGKLYADNLLEVARQVKLSVEHGKSLDDLDLDFDITIGKAKNTIQTRANYNGADKLIEAIKKTPVGVLVNEATLATGVAIAYSLGTAMTRRALSSRAAALITFGGSALLAGTFTGFAENKRLKEDRRQHARETAQGRTYEHGASPRREQMDAFIQETREAGALAAGIRSRLYEVGLDGKQEIKNLSEKEQQDVIAHLADMEARVALADREAIDLIAYSSPMTIEQERLDFDIARAQAKVDIRKMQDKTPLEGGKKFDDLLELATQARMEELTKKEGGIDARNAAFNKMKEKKVAGAVFKGATIGLVIGATVQEGMAFADSSKIGFVEHLVKGNGVATEGATRVTPTEYLRGLFTNSLPVGDPGSHTLNLGPNGHLTLPASYALSPSEHGLQITHDGKVLADGLNVQSDGSLDAESLKELSQKGFLITSSVEHITHQASSQVPTHEFMAKHPELSTHVKRDLWFDNDTPKPVFDKNELKLWWGGKDNIGLDAGGNYEFTVDHMTPGGSYHDGLSVKAGDLVKEGKMKMLFSVSSDTQTRPIEVPIGADGKVHIDSNSETGKLLFKTVNGKPQFLGRFAEVAEVTGTDADKTDHVRILATYEGKGVAQVPSNITTVVPETRTTLTTPADYRVELPPIIPVFGRTPLEPVNGIRRPAPIIGLPPRYYYYNSAPSEEEKKEYEQRFDRRLKGNPDAILNPESVQKTYLDSLDPLYKEKIQRLSEQAGPMSPECKLAICIPVAGHQEGANIERTLSAYLNQSADPSTYEIVLFVNQPDVDPSGRKIKSDGTLDTIKTFKEQHPEINIRVMESMLPRSEAKIGNIRKLLNDATVMRSSGRPGGPEVILVSNDADTRGVAPTYVDNLEKKFQENPKTDAYFGQLDWDPESYIRNPLVHIGARLYQYIALQQRRAQGGTESSGANFAFRSTIYSAIGGYSSNTGLGEDNDLGRRMVYARSSSKNHTSIDFAGARVSRIYTSSRRAEKAVQDGRSFIEQWSNGFSAFDDDVRKVNWEDGAATPNYDDPEVVAKLTKQLETTINRTLMVAGDWWSGNRYSPMARKALGLLGIKYKVVGPRRIEITDASKLIAGLKEYSEDGMEIMERKIAKIGTRASQDRKGRRRRANEEKSEK